MEQTRGKEFRGRVLAGRGLRKRGTGRRPGEGGTWSFRNC